MVLTFMAKETVSTLKGSRSSFGWTSVSRLHINTSSNDTLLTPLCCKCTNIVASCVKNKPHSSLEMMLTLEQKELIVSTYSSFQTVI